MSATDAPARNVVRASVAFPAPRALAISVLAPMPMLDIACRTSTMWAGQYVHIEEQCLWGLARALA